MRNSPKRTGALAIGLLMASTLAQTAWAQNEHAGHHPANGPAPATSSPSPAAPPAGAKGGMQGMPMQHGMMQADMPMCSMMGGGMMRGGMMRGGMMRGGMNMASRAETRLAALRRELAITQAQEQSWDAYAQALRTNAATMDRMHSEMMAGMSAAKTLTPVERLDHHAQMMSTAQNAIATLRPAIVRLYDSLSAEQRKKADMLLVPDCSMKAGMPMRGMKPGMPMRGMKPQM